MKPRQRGALKPWAAAHKEALKPRQEKVVDHLMYVAQDIGDGPRTGWRWDVDCDTKTGAHPCLVLFLDVEIPARSTESENFIAVIARAKTGLDEVQEVERIVGRVLSNTGVQREPMLVGVADRLQRPQPPAHAAIPAMVRLYRFDDLFRRYRDIADFVPPAFIESLELFLDCDVGASELVQVDWELTTLVRRAGADKPQLPYEVVEARAKVMDHIARNYAESQRRELTHFQAPDIISILRVYLMSQSIRLVPQKSGGFIVKRCHVLMGSVELGFGPFKGGHD